MTDATNLIEVEDAVRLINVSGVLASMPAPPDPKLDPYIDATERCLVRHGLARTSIQDVAAEADVSRSTIYRVAGTLDDLLQAVMLRNLHRFLASIPGLVLGKSGPDALVDTIASYIEGARSGPMLVKDLQDDPDQAAADLQQHFPDLLDQLTVWLAPMLRAAAQLELIADRDAERIAQWISRITVSLILLPPPGDLRAFLAEVLVPALERRSEEP